MENLKVSLKDGCKNMQLGYIITLWIFWDSWLGFIK